MMRFTLTILLCSLLDHLCTMYAVACGVVDAEMSTLCTMYAMACGVVRVIRFQMILNFYDFYAHR